MTRIERIEQILSEWKAKSNRAKAIHHDRAYKSYQDTILGLHLALDVVKGPSNTKLKLDALDCSKCNGHRQANHLSCGTCKKVFRTT